MKSIKKGRQTFAVVRDIDFQNDTLGRDDVAPVARNAIEKLIDPVKPLRHREHFYDLREKYTTQKIPVTSPIASRA